MQPGRYRGYQTWFVSYLRSTAVKEAIVMLLVALLTARMAQPRNDWQYHFGKPSRGRYHNHEWAAKMKAVARPLPQPRMAREDEGGRAAAVQHRQAGRQGGRPKDVRLSDRRRSLHS